MAALKYGHTMPAERKVIDPHHTDIDAIIREFPEHNVIVEWFGLMGTVRLSLAGMTQARGLPMTKSNAASAQVWRESVGGSFVPGSLEQCISALKAATSSV